jgi:type VI secretion system protein ImpG
MNIEQYFEREYNFLQVAGEEFAEKHQAIAGKLRMTERQRKDPFVERLMEAFAFLAGRIHERLDDEIPEFTGGLLEQLFPQMLRPFPSCAILEAEAMSGAITRPVTVPRGSEVQTPTGKYKVKYRVSAAPDEQTRTVEKIEPAEFIFRTTHDLVVRPMRLRDVRIDSRADATSVLVLTIQPDKNVTYEDLGLDSLRLYLSGAESMKYSLLLHLAKHVRGLEMKELSDGGTGAQNVYPYSVTVPGLTDTDRQDASTEDVLPYSRQSFKGYRHLQEYFAFPERFFFVDIQGLEKFQASDEGYPFEIAVIFDRKLSLEFRPTKKNVLLHCAPVINLFNRSVEEVFVNQRLPEYYITPDITRRKSREIYSVNAVSGISENRQQQYHYIPVASYDVLDTYDPEYEYKRFYSIVRREMPADVAETAIRLFGPSMEEGEFPKETLSIEATLSNGFLPSKYLEVGSINEPVHFPGGLKVKNLTVPTEVLPYPERKNFLWVLISHLSLSYRTLAETETLKTVLSLYNWIPSHNNPNKKRIESIVRVQPPVIKNVFRERGLVRGIEFKVEIDGKQFEHGEGDIYLFGSVLNRFLSEYVTINSYVILTMIDIETRKEYRWEPNPGNILSL